MITSIKKPTNARAKRIADNRELDKNLIAQRLNLENGC